MPILLPDEVVPREMEHRFIDAGGWQRGPLGGADTRVDRPGSRFGITLQFPPLETKQQGRLVVARLIGAVSEGMRVELPLGDFDPGITGAPVVDGDDQAGTSLAVRGFTPHYQVREGQWFTHIRGDDALLYNVAANVVADASGDAVVTFRPELRVEPVDGDVLLFGKPMIQGRPTGNEARWRLPLEKLLGFEIDLEEMR